MFIVFLKFSANKAAASEFMPAHSKWLATGFDAGVFQCAGLMTEGTGGMILAKGESRAALETRVNADPFVINDVVTAEIIEVDVKKTAPAFDTLKA